MNVVIIGKNLEMGIKNFRKKGQKEGIIKEARLRQAAEKPSDRKKRKAQEAVARKRKRRNQFRNNK